MADAIVQSKGAPAILGIQNIAKSFGATVAVRRVAFVIVSPHSDEHAQTALPAAHDVPVDRHLRVIHPLHDRSHGGPRLALARPAIQA